MTGIVLATDSAEFEARVRQAFNGSLNGDLRRFGPDLGLGATGSSIGELAAGDPDVIAVGPGPSIERILETARVLDRERPEIAVVIVADPTARLWEQALRAGARDVIAPEAPATDVREALERARETAHRRRSIGGSDEPQEASHRVIAVLSPKGGSGKTTIATNLAVGLARTAPNEVVIVDLDLQFGDVMSALGLVPEQTIADTARTSAPLDATRIKAYLTPHPANLFALCAPDFPAEADGLSPEHVAKVVELLTGEFRYVILDTAAGIDEQMLAALDHATDLLLVSATDVASARGMGKEVEALDRIGITAPKRHFVLNRADARVGLSASDIEGTIGMNVDVAVPSSRNVPLSMNQGLALIESDPRSAVSRSLSELVTRFAPATQTSGTRSWRLRGMK